jgi:WD40 repeat protein
MNLALDAGAQWLASSGKSGTLELWDVGEGRAADPPLAGHFGNVQAASFSADARRVASIAEGHAMVWDVATHAAIGQCSWGTAGPGSEIALSPDGRIAAVTGGGDPTIGLCVAPDR